MDTTLTQAVPLVVITAALAFWAWCLWDFQRTPPSQMRTYTESQWWVILVLGSVGAVAAAIPNIRRWIADRTSARTDGAVNVGTMQ